jgi:outer membrane lipase/esterase
MLRLVSTLNARLWLGLILALSPLAAPAGVYYDLLYVLGDSQSDGGNVALTTTERSTPPFGPVPFFPYAVSDRYTGGLIWADYLAADLGVAALPSLAGGTNYAFGGARIVNGPRPQKDLSAQTASLLMNTGGLLSPTALYAVWGGANDAFDALADQDLAIIDTAIAALEGILRDLADAGAVHFLVPNLGDGGVAPLFAEQAAAATFYTGYFNDLLAAMLADLALDRPELSIIALDVFSLSQDVVGNPGAYGFSYATQPCLTFGDSDPATAFCADPDNYVFWDALHFTSAANRVLADAAYRAVPAPIPLVLMAVGLVALLSARALPQRRRGTTRA